MAYILGPVSDLKPWELRVIERSLDMMGGFVLDFTNRTFDEFFQHELGVEIYSETWSNRGDSKANRLRAYLLGSSPATVARALRALWTYRQNTLLRPASTVDSERFLAIARRLESLSDAARTDSILPFESNETLEELVAAIERDVQANSPRAALDRLHTYCMKKFAHLIKQYRAGVIPADTLNARAGQYFNDLRREAKEVRPISFEIMGNAIKLLEKYNNIRNDHSFAHDNTLIGKAEARLIFDAIASMLRFVKATEGQRFGT